MLSNDKILDYKKNGLVIPEFKMPEEHLLEIEDKHNNLIKKNP